MGQMTPQPATLPNQLEITLGAMHPDQEHPGKSTVELAIKDLAAAAIAANASMGKKDVLVVDASVKPYINLVWGGLIILLVGFAVTIVRRVGQSRQQPVTAGESADVDPTGAIEVVPQ
jgi:hypothetical protein